MEAGEDLNHDGTSHKSCHTRKTKFLEMFVAIQSWAHRSNFEKRFACSLRRLQAERDRRFDRKRQRKGRVADSAVILYNLRQIASAQLKRGADHDVEGVLHRVACDICLDVQESSEKIMEGMFSVLFGITLLPPALPFIRKRYFGVCLLIRELRPIVLRRSFCIYQNRIHAWSAVMFHIIDPVESVIVCSCSIQVAPGMWTRRRRSGSHRDIDSLHVTAWNYYCHRARVNACVRLSFTVCLFVGLFVHLFVWCFLCLFVHFAEMFLCVVFLVFCVLKGIYIYIYMYYTCI